MTQQSEAQRLAAALDALLGYRGINADVGKAAAELRRQEAVIQQLLEALEMVYADTMDYIKRNHLSGAANNHWIVAARAAIAAAKDSNAA
jgi:hypothetical protein